MRRLLGTVCVVGLALSTVGCGGAGRLVEQEDPFTRAPVGESVVRLHVQNLNFNEARLFALGLASRIRLGVVSGKRDAVFSIPWDHSEPMRIEIDILAGRRCTTREIQVDPGDTLDLTIEEDFFQTVGCD